MSAWLICSLFFSPASLKTLFSEIFFRSFHLLYNFGDRTFGPSLFVNQSVHLQMLALYLFVWLFGCFLRQVWLQTDWVLHLTMPAPWALSQPHRELSLRPSSTTTARPSTDVSPWRSVVWSERTAVGEHRSIGRMNRGTEMWFTLVCGHADSQTLSINRGTRGLFTCSSSSPRVISPFPLLPAQSGESPQRLVTVPMALDLLLEMWEFRVAPFQKKKVPLTHSFWYPTSLARDRKGQSMWRQKIMARHWEGWERRQSAEHMKCV